MKLKYLFLFLFLAYFCTAQNKEALLLYNVGVEQYNKKLYDSAITIFTKSLEREITKDTYFARALCYGKTANKADYCNDLASASVHGEGKATSLFLKSCGTIDSVYVKNELPPNENLSQAKVIYYTTFDSTQYIFKKDERKHIYSVGGKLQDSNLVYLAVEQAPEFPGGINAMMKFLSNNIQFPVSAREDNRFNGGKVFLKFTVFEDGTLHDITVLKGVPNFPQCDREAIRVVTVMPLWKPAYYGGKPVKAYFNLPFSFKKK